jgi:CubicO group peptidase (beta-lactamase class C family)
MAERVDRFDSTCRHFTERVLAAADRLAVLREWRRVFRPSRRVLCTDPGLCAQESTPGQTVMAMNRRRSRSLAFIFIAALAAMAPLASANDDCSDFIDLSGMPLPLTVTGTTTGLDNDYGPFLERPECWQGERWRYSSAQGADATYKWTAPAAGWYTFSLCHSDAFHSGFFNTDLLLYEFTCPAEPRYPEDFICGNDTGCTANALLKDIPLVAGQEVLVVVDGGVNGEGAFELAIHETSELEPAIAALIDIHRIPGAAATAVGPAGPLWNGNFGLADIAAGRPVTDSTLFYIASASKPVTGAALMQLYDDGLFDLDDDVNDYLPFPVRNPLFPDSAMTFRMLLSHVSGIEDNWDVMESVIVCDQDSPIPLGQFLADYLVPGGPYYDPERNFTDAPPGTAYRYSNVGASLAGYLVESIYGATHPGATLESYCQERLFAPLGMDETSWFLSGVDLNRVATPYAVEAGQHIPLCHIGIPWFPSTMLRTSAPQLGRFVTAFLRGGELGGWRILESATVDTILTLHYPELYDYGLLWSGEDWIGLPTWNHGGVYLGTRTLIWLFPEEDLGGVVLTNGESTDGMWDITRRVMLESLRYASGVAPESAPPPAFDSLPAPALAPITPNPFLGATAIRYELPAPAVVSLRILDVQGRLVRVLAGGAFGVLEPAGAHAVHWDGRDQTGAAAPAGVYLCVLDAGAVIRSAKVTLLR